METSYVHSTLPSSVKVVNLKLERMAILGGFCRLYLVHISILSMN